MQRSAGVKSRPTESAYLLTLRPSVSNVFVDQISGSRPKQELNVTLIFGLELQVVAVKSDEVSCIK